MCSVTHIPTLSPGFGACAASQFFIRWVGTTTDCRPNVVCKIILVCRATRVLLMTLNLCRLFVATCQKIIVRLQFLAQTSLHYAKSSHTKTKKYLKTCFADLDCRSTGRCCTPPSAITRDAQVKTRSCATCRAARLTHKKHQRCGTSILELLLRKPN